MAFGKKDKSKIQNGIENGKIQSGNKEEKKLLDEEKNGSADQVCHTFLIQKPS